LTAVSGAAILWALFDFVNPLNTKGYSVVSILAYTANTVTSQSAQHATAFLFYALGLLTCLSAWSIVFSQNIIRMSVYLLLTLAGAAGLYLLLNVELLAAIQLIVYAGGTLILIVFGIMLTSKNPFLQLRVGIWEQGVGVLCGLIIAALLIVALVHSPLPVNRAADAASDYGQVDLIGRALLSAYVVPFEIVAVLLLVVMIAAAFMARKRTQ